MFAAKDMGGDAIVSDNETYEKKNINRPAAAIVG